ncbi:MAG: tRNA (N6-isopentenyl adenosine(37)-C2)-methylthiotransferase MiaB [Parasporobacterium sp.]|nr:tRNA (N6-isopentenyl adenosine(37)-C2)-methylthiotransferase MiaB [Parasporobacterium sp.]
MNEKETLIKQIIENAPVNEPARQYYFIEKCRKIILERAEKLGRPLLACVNTFGCQMNARDSEKLLGILLDMGYVETDTEEADFVLYNTCTVREHANVRVYGRLGVLKRYKDQNPDMIIALCGCMMQEPEVVEKVRKSYSHVNIIFGTHNVFKLAELMFSYLVTDVNVTEIWDSTDMIVEDLPSCKKYSYKCGVNIMYGCNNFCSYCKVPYVRGRERSRKPEDIIKEIEEAVANGIVEIMLLGQNVNSYSYGFPELLRKVCAIDGLKRVRFMTSHPKDLSPELIEVMKSEPKLCSHLHLPMQSGSSRILKLMNRHYTKEDYLDLVNRIRTAIPDIAITTDIIVGFPGETEEDFLETMDAVKKAGFESAFTFIYSKRTGTKAASFEDQVPEDIVKDRFDRLLKLVTDIAKEKTLLHVGKEMDVLVEEVNPKEPGYVTGRLSNNSVVHFPGGPEMIGSVVNVKLDQGKGFYYIGSLTHDVSVSGD